MHAPADHAPTAPQPARPHRATAIIPARLGSTRFPGKVLADQTGQPMVIHVAQRAARAASIARVVLATDAEEVARAANDHGFEAVMTSLEHTNGTSRLAEAARLLGLSDDTLVVNVQGDEPEIDPALIDAAADAACEPGRAPSGARAGATSGADGFGSAPPRIGTVASPFTHESADDPNIVKAVLAPADGRGIARALYFSRAAVPFDRDGAGVARYRHVGLYAYTVRALRAYAALPATPLEHAEKLEQLRALEHGWVIAAAIRPSTHTGIDTPEQYADFVARARLSRV